MLTGSTLALALTDAEREKKWPKKGNGWVVWMDR